LHPKFQDDPLLWRATIVFWHSAAFWRWPLIAELERRPLGSLDVLGLPSKRELTGYSELLYKYLLRHISDRACLYGIMKSRLLPSKCLRFLTDPPGCGCFSSRQFPSIWKFHLSRTTSQGWEFQLSVHWHWEPLSSEAWWSFALTMVCLQAFNSFTRVYWRSEEQSSLFLTREPGRCQD